MEATLLRFVAVGSVDDGKSTLIGRLLHDTKGVYEDQLAGTRRGPGGDLDLSLITDGLRAEREQGITIDVAYRYFATERRRFIIADTPGHVQYTRNMVTGASTADAAVILIDARLGVLTQTLRHAYLAWLLGIRRICVAVNKMDAVGFSRERFEEIRGEFARRSGELAGLAAGFIPVSALEGDNVARRSGQMGWYEGPTLLEHLEEMETGGENGERGLRLAVQCVLRGGNGDRYYAGQVSGGRVRVGDEVMVLPSGRRARVAGVRVNGEEGEEARAPLAAAVSLAEHVDVARGDMLTSVPDAATATRKVRAVLFWMSEQPLAVGKPYLLKHTTQTVCAEVTQLEAGLDVETLRYGAPAELGLNGIARALVETQRPIYCDAYARNRATGSFIVVDPATNGTVAAGIIEEALAGEGREGAGEELRAPAGHAGAVVWLTGLSSAGKSTVAGRVEERLRELDYRVEMLDGDVMRRQLCKDLGFSREDRDENIRRIGFVAELLARNGVIAIVAAISPYRAVREEIRGRVDNFVEVFVNAPLGVCEQRDVKGLYRKARAGEMKGMTGVDDPYEPPERPEVECRTDRESVAESAEKVVAAVCGRLGRASY